MTVQIMNFERTIKENLINFDLDSFTVEDKDDIYSISFDITLIRPSMNDVGYNMIQNEAIILYDGQHFVIKKSTEDGNGSVTSKSVTAVHEFYTIQDCFQYDTISGTKSIQDCLNHVFKADTHGFEYEVVNTNGIIGRVEQENFGNGNLLKLIEEVMTDYDVTIIKNNKLITFYPNEYFGIKTENQIRYQLNTDDVSFSIDTYNFKTQIKGFGKRKDPEEGQEQGDYHFEPVTYTSPMADIWGIRIQDPVSDERYTVRSNMISRLKQDLKDYFDISGTVSLKQLDYPVTRGDSVRFIYEPLNINQFIKVVGITSYPFSNNMPSIELDNSKKTILDYVVALSKGVK